MEGGRPVEVRMTKTTKIDRARSLISAVQVSLPPGQPHPELPGSPTLRPPPWGNNEPRLGTLIRKGVICYCRKRDEPYLLGLVKDPRPRPHDVSPMVQWYVDHFGSFHDNQTCHISEKFE